MNLENKKVVNALIKATSAPGAIAKLKALKMSPEAAADIIRHVSTIPAFTRNLGQGTGVNGTRRLQPLNAERLVFLHLPKCGGTTLHNMLVDWYGPANMHPERFNGLYQSSVQDLASKTLFSGHYDYYSTQLVPGNPRLITFLRDPRSRLVSLYHFHRSHREDHIEKHGLKLARWANAYDIDEYFANPEVRAHPGINNTITRNLSSQPLVGPNSVDVNLNETPIEVLREQATANLARFDFVGFIEDYDASIARLTKILNRPIPKTIERARNFATLDETSPHMKKIDKQEPSAKTHALMSDLVHEDEIVYQFAKKLMSN
jgi:hypothetical protein